MCHAEFVVHICIVIGEIGNYQISITNRVNYLIGYDVGFFIGIGSLDCELVFERRTDDELKKPIGRDANGTVIASNWTYDKAALFVRHVLSPLILPI